MPKINATTHNGQRPNRSGTPPRPNYQRLHLITPTAEINHRSSKTDDRELCPFKGLNAPTLIIAA
jgi:hypothetical protein